MNVITQEAGTALYAIVTNLVTLTNAIVIPGTTVSALDLMLGLLLLIGIKEMNKKVLGVGNK